MHKKIGYVAAACALLASIVTAIAIATNTENVSSVLAVATVIMCTASILSVHFAFQKSEATPLLQTPIEKPSRRSADSISAAADPGSLTNDEAKANAESAMSAEAAGSITHRDDESGLLSGSFFPVYLEQRITAARRTLRPVSLVIFELDGLDKNDTHSPSDKNFFISAVGDVVKRTLRESDCAFRLDENIFAATMDDTTESGAVWAAERVRGVLHTGALAGRVTVSAGVACYPSHALETQELIDCANNALDIARSRGVDQVEIAAADSQA